MIRAERVRLGIGNDAKFHGAADRWFLIRTFRHLEIHLQRAKLADAETGIVLADRLADAHVAPRDHSRKRGAELGLLELNLQALDLRLVALHQARSNCRFRKR